MTSPLHQLFDNYQPPKPELYEGSRPDEPRPSRLCHTIQCVNLQQHWSKLQSMKQDTACTVLAIVGFCSDEGVKRNYGRTGAKQGPDAIRKAIKGMPLHGTNVHVVDCGDVFVEGSQLEQGQKALGKVTKAVAQHVDMVFVFGGGHEVAYAHYLGQLSPTSPPPAIFNFDAHFDLRKMDHASSGTPFLQIHDLLKEHNQSFRYNVLGIQKASNTEVLFETAKKLNVNYMETEQVYEHGMQHVIESFVAPFVRDNDQIYVTICLDAFNGGCAPGVSAVNPFGLEPFHVLRSLKELIRSKKVKHIDIAEMNPQYDMQGLTARLSGAMFQAVVEELESQ